MKRLLHLSEGYPVWLVFLLFVLVTLGFTYPLVTELTTHFAGENIDVWLNMWANWWTGKALREGLPLYHTTEILHPHGVSLYFHSFSHTNTVPWLLLEPLVGPLAAYNLVVVTGFVLLGLGIALVVWELTGAMSAGIVSGLAATFAPYHVWECVHPNIFTTQYTVLALWALIRTLHPAAGPTERAQTQRRWKSGLLVGLFLTLSALSGWHQPLYAVFLLGPYLVWTVLSRGRTWSRQVWVGLFVAALAAILLIGPAVLPLIREQLRAGYAEPEIDWVFNTDALAWLTPSFLHPLWGDGVRPIYERFPAPNRPAFLGYTVLALALVGLRSCWRNRRDHGWLFVSTLLSAVMALGTQISVNGNVIVSDLPWYRPVIGFLRTPVRLNLMLGHCLAIMAGFGVRELLAQRALGVGHRALGAGVISVLVLFEFLAWPFPSTPEYVSPFYEQLVHEPDDFAIVEAPLDRQTDKLYMYWQTIHEKALVNGHVSRPPESAFDFIERNAVSRAFTRREPLPQGPELAAALQGLADADVRHVVIHKAFLPSDLAESWSQELATRPLYEDDDLVVFATLPQPGVHIEAAQILDPTSGPTLSQAWVNPGEPPELVTHWSSTQPRTVVVELAPVGPAVDEVSVGPTSVHTQLLAVPQGPFSKVRTPLNLPDDPAEDIALSLRLPQGSDSNSVSICQFSDDAPAGFCARTRPDAVWAQSLALRGMDWHRLANTLHVTLHWEAERTPAADYVRFVHLGPADGPTDARPVAQSDGEPCAGSCPTTGWTVGEPVLDSVQIPLRDVAGGTLRLALGWYNPDTQERLPGVDFSGRGLSDDRLLLDETVTVPHRRPRP